MKKIVVVGSLNMDSVVETPHIPKSGETIAGKNLRSVPGGKGANQAYAIGKLGGNVGMIGAIGKDEPGKRLKENLESVNVDTSGLIVMDNQMTGQAYIAVDEHGENSIIIIAGANGSITRQLIKGSLPLIDDSDIIIMQLEIPVEVVNYVKDYAVRKGKTVIIDPAPATEKLPDNLWKGVHYIKPNESELEILVGERMSTTEEQKKGARKMLGKGVKNVIVTLGDKGCLLVNKETEQFFPAETVKSVDTTAAGDGFTAAFALTLSAGKSCEEAIAFGQKVSAVIVTRKGAQTSIPGLQEMEKQQ